MPTILCFFLQAAPLLPKATPYPSLCRVYLAKIGSELSPREVVGYFNAEENFLCVFIKN